MTRHITGTREEWLTARLDLLAAEKELTRRSDELARRRQELPWVRIEKEYRFEIDEGSASLADLFRGRSQLLVYHFMFGPDYTAGCPSCSAIADGFDGFAVHLANHDVMLWAVSRAPLAKLQPYKRRMGWTFRWASSLASDFNFDFTASFTEEQQRQGGVEYNYRRESAWQQARSIAEWRGDEGPVDTMAAMAGTDAATYTRERPGVSAFTREDGVVYHTYSTYARGLDALWGMYQWLDRAPRGRNETGVWWRRHDEYDKR
ncbi:MAG: DUF899 domain-containing protein [Thermoanaerobaculia bacterium]